MPAPISIIIPTLNAGGDLPACIDSLIPGIEAGLIRELVISDGGSNDATRLIAEGAGADLVTGEPGRAAQLIRGAEAARGDWLLFLHADTALSRDWTERVADHLESRPDKAAVFSLVYRSDARMAKRIASRANRRTRWLGLPYGDQGLLIPRKLYDEIGGYDDIPLMEDVRIVQAIGRKRLAILSAEARTSAAKYERDGWRRRSWKNAWLITRYLMGASPEKLAREYR
ncbi:glycosyltransferase [Henriciella mobilis]|uniref:TIGR04283 family arsenosugar biosynthesis glycosyltransferase n=1 Tax=Henriciella mobilis TaxID=2305467 RepID=UPI000E661D3F|nr:TIGR04283 family arsenosugar biosynthesis glycosyltransferase [Henriciella mobilis]RIJ13909.1 glycosyltransferase [Henriciella mobilis]RIJ20882.1 glycosyltransferase [Henriciella mobilis]